MRHTRALRLGLKRGIDVLVSLLLLVGLSPALVCIAGVIRVTMGSPVLFRQRRTGKLGEDFVLLKFRTMSHAVRSSDGPSDDELRMTPLGRVLRHTSLDELPELLNVIRGEMSLVGPRPLLPEYRSRYSASQWRRHEMRPGMAGPAVARGRNSLSWEKKFEWDVWYVDNWSLSLDLRLGARSLTALLSRRGVSAPDHVTMPEFLGNGKGDS